MSAFALILAIAAGIALAVQGAANAALAHHVGRLEAAVISFLGGTLVLLGISACIGELPQLSSLGEVPLWQCMGGIYGALLVTAIIYGTPVLGAALTFAAFMFGQLFFGMMVDGLGLFDVSVRVLTVGRIIGCVLLAVGIIAVCYGRMLEKAPAPKTPSSKEALVTSYPYTRPINKKHSKRVPLFLWPNEGNSSECSDISTRRQIRLCNLSR